MVEFPPAKEDDPSDKSDKKDPFKQKDQGARGKMPDFIIIEDTQDYLRGNYKKASQSSHQEEKKTFTPPQSLKGPIIIRLLCFLGTFLFLLIAIGMLMWTGIVFLLNCVTFFQVQTLNEYLRKFWDFYVNTSVMALGLGAAVISPAFGLGLLVVYFSVKGSTQSAQILKEFLRRII